MVKVLSLCNFAMAETRKEGERSGMQVAGMAKAKQRDRLVRNFIITGIVLSASFFILFPDCQNCILQAGKLMAVVLGISPESI